MSDFDEYDAEFTKLKAVDRTDSERLASLRKIKARGKNKKFHVLPMFVSGAAILVVLFLMLSFNGNTSTVENGKSIVDDQTALEIPIVDVTPNMFIVEYGSDNMDRGNHDYETIGTNKRIAIDSELSDFRRGDVVYFKVPAYSNGNPDLNLAEHHISRVIGLPGEKIEIKKGQVFIDDKELEAFYSFPTVRGMNKEEYLETVNPLNSTMTAEDFEEDMEPISVPEGSLFVIGDQWWRSIDSRHFGPISLNEVEGKVLGYVRSQ